MEDINIIKQLMDVGAVKFGNFLLKSGVSSPIYIDLRVIVSYPDLLTQLSEKVWAKKIEKNIEVDAVCGVPYTALPISTTISVSHNVPMILKRKEAKGYGTKKMLEGNFQTGQKCLIIEDIVTSGSSVLETATVLRNEGLTVTDCIVLLNRKQGGQENLAKCGITLHSLFNLNDVISLVADLNIVSESTITEVKNYLKDNAFIDAVNLENKVHLPLLERAKASTHPILKKLWNIIIEKQTNLCVAVDVTKSSELLELAEVLGPHICILKTHIDILEDFSENIPASLRQISKKYNFLILEDRKFADIGATVYLQYIGGIYKIQDWADIVTVHSIPGDHIITALKSKCTGDKACILIAEMSSKGALTNEFHQKQTVAIAEAHPDFVIGFIAQSRLANNNLIYMCPGVHLEDSGDDLGQQYKSPEEAIRKKGVDIIIVGRGITKATNIVEAVELYKTRAFKALVL